MKLFPSKKNFLLFPKISRSYFLIYLLIICILCLILGITILKNPRKFETAFNSWKWEKENKLIVTNNFYKQGFTLSTNTSGCIFKSYNNDAHSISKNKITKVTLCSQKKLGGKVLRNTNFINDFVWRSKVYNVSQKKTAHTRIFVVGDSIIWGYGYTNMNDIWWRKLQRELVKRGYYDVEVIGVGWLCENTRDEFKDVKIALKAYNPDIVVWGYLENDPDEHIIKFDKSKYQKWILDLLEGENFEQYKKTIRDVSYFIKENNKTPIFFVTLPIRPSSKIYIPRYNKIFSLFKSNNIKIYDTLPAFEKESYTYPAESLAWKINPADGHPGVIATDFYARQVANILEKNYPNTLPKKYAGNRPNEPFINDWVPMTFDIKQNGNILNFEYPSDTQNFLSMPYGYKYIQLNLSYPKKVKKILLNGSDLKSARLDIIYENPKDQTVYQLGFKKGQKLTWQNFKSKELVNSIRINADFSSNKNKFITLKIITEENN